MVCVGQKAQGVHVLIQAAVLRVMLAGTGNGVRPNAPVDAEEPEQVRAALARTQAGRQLPALSPRLTSGYIHRPRRQGMVTDLGHVGLVCDDCFRSQAGTVPRC